MSIIIIALALLLLGVPIGIAMLSVGYFGFLDAGINMQVIAQRMFAGLDSFTLMAIPLFVFAGDILLYGGASKRLIRFANACFGWITGGIPVTAVVSSMVFSALTGSASATVAGIGGIMIPNMVEAKYPPKFSTGLLAAAGCMGIIIPPSITFMAYGVSLGYSIGDLFLAGLLPGLFIGFILIAYVVIYSHIKQFEKEPRPSLKELWIAFKESIWALLTPVIILGGIYAGIMTPTEAAAIAIVYSLFICVVVYKELDLKGVLKVAGKSCIMIGMIMFVVATADVLSWFLTFRQIPAQVAEIILSISDNRVVILLLINVLLLIAWMLMNATTVVLILAPLFYPVITSLGVDPIHFGVIMIVNLAIGFVTPPFGLNLFVASGISGLGITDVVKGTAPFILLMFIALLIITFVPGLSLIFM